MNQTSSEGIFNQVASGINPTRILSRWSPSEGRALVSAMNDLLDLGGWKTDNRQFKNGAYAKLEAIMKQKEPGFEKKAKPHIESRVKLLRKQYDAISEMLSPSASGFGWNENGKFVTCPQSVWDDWIKSHKNAVGLRNKPFPFFDELGKIFGKDRAVSNEAENVVDVLEEREEEERGGEEPRIPNNNEEYISPTSQRTPMGPLSSATTSTTKTKLARIETIETLKDFSTKLAKISDMMEGASEHIGRLASCFQHESNFAKRRMKVTSEIMKMEALSPNEVISVSKKIVLNPHKFDFFFSLPGDYRYAYVQGLLLPDSMVLMLIYSKQDISSYMHSVHLVPFEYVSRIFLVLLERIKYQVQLMLNVRSNSLVQPDEIFW